jgi:hypothetical protein
MTRLTSHGLIAPLPRAVENGVSPGAFRVNPSPHLTLRDGLKKRQKIVSLSRFFSKSDGPSPIAHLETKGTNEGEPSRGKVEQARERSEAERPRLARRAPAQRPLLSAVDKGVRRLSSAELRSLRNQCIILSDLKKVLKCKSWEDVLLSSRNKLSPELGVS